VTSLRDQNMNAVERILVYSELPSEGEATSSNDPPASWPEKGAVSFSDVELTYRPGLPLVLKGISFHVNAGEKVQASSITILSLAQIEEFSRLE